MDLEALMVERAEEQIEAKAWKDDLPDSWVMATRQKCGTCGKIIPSGEKQMGPVCAACKRKAKRVRCFACDKPAAVRGYCRNHWDQVYREGVVDPLHIGARDGNGAPPSKRPITITIRGRAA